MARLGGRRKQAPEVDELGGRSDGALAILTPGFLRGIFESDARLNEAQRQAPAQSGDGESGAEDAGTEEGE